jgi:thiosulfate/3-mercaptopyruvate sulfurtransferase
MHYSSLITVEELAGRIDDPDWIIVDCRYHPKLPGWGFLAYATAHLPGAFYAHLDGHLSGPMRGDNGRHPLPEPGAFAAWLGSLGVGPATQVVAYDDAGGPYAARLWWMLRWVGHRHTAVLDGGWQSWQAHRRPIDTGLILPAEALAYPIRLEMNYAIDTASLERDLQNLLLIDARAPQRILGIGEDQDPVGGHIPGARNRHFRDNLASHGCFKSATELREAFRQLLDNHPPEHTVHLCGSGITACHNLLAMEIAGLGGGRLYPGSWSEWCSDPRRPRTTQQDLAP